MRPKILTSLVKEGTPGRGVCVSEDGFIPFMGMIDFTS